MWLINISTLCSLCVCVCCLQEFCSHGGLRVGRRTNRMLSKELVRTSKVVSVVLDRLPVRKIQ